MPHPASDRMRLFVFQGARGAQGTDPRQNRAAARPVQRCQPHKVKTSTVASSPYVDARRTATEGVGANLKDGETSRTTDVRGPPSASAEGGTAPLMAQIRESGASGKVTRDSQSSSLARPRAERTAKHPGPDRRRTISALVSGPPSHPQPGVAVALCPPGPRAFVRCPPFPASAPAKAGGSARRRE
jgi:hypothetical protein